MGINSIKRTRDQQGILKNAAILFLFFVFIIKAEENIVEFNDSASGQSTIDSSFKTIRDTEKTSGINFLKKDTAKDDLTERGSIEIMVFPNTAEVYINGKFIGKGSQLVENVRPGIYKIKAKNNKRIKTKTIKVLAGQKQQLTFSAAAPTFILAPGWDFDISRDGFITGPSLEIGLKKKNHSVCITYSWCFFPVLEDTKNTYNYHHYVGGGAIHFNEMVNKGALSFSIGEVIGFWNYWDTRNSFFTGEESFYYLFGGPAFKIKLGNKKYFFALTLTTFMGLAQREDENSSGYQASFAVKNTVRGLFCLEL